MNFLFIQFEVQSFCISKHCAQTLCMFQLPFVPVRMFRGSTLLPVQVFQVVYLMWTQCTVDIFFMDWERSRGVLVNRNLTSVPKGARPDSVPTPVSIWRTYFVANEWNEIQSSRSINHRLLLVIVLLFLQASSSITWPNSIGFTLACTSEASWGYLVSVYCITCT